MKNSIVLAIILTIVGCGGSNSLEEQPPPIVTIPPAPSTPQGTVLEETCNDTTLVQTIADGNGGSDHGLHPMPTPRAAQAAPYFKRSVGALGVTG